MDYLPIFIDVRARACLVVGGGSVAARKVELLQQAGASVHVVAPRLCQTLSGLAAAGALLASQREYDARDLDGVCVAIAATDRAEINARVAADARLRTIPVNVVDSPLLCTFIMPAIVDRSPVLVAVSTAGASPILSRLTRARVEAALPQRLGRLAEFAARHRAAIKARIASSAQRRAFWERVLDGEVGESVLAGREAEAELELELELRFRGTHDSSEAARATLIATGTGDLDRLSLGALRALGSASVLMHETEALPLVLALGRRDAERIDVGMLGVASAWAWPRLASEIAERSARGQRVCLVRCADPYAVGVPQDVGALQAAGVRCEILRPAP